MGVIYENEVKGIGDMVEAFKDEGVFILFGDNAPDTLKDFCYTITVKKALDIIKEGQTLEIDGVSYKILSVGDVMQKNLEALGHITVNFSGDVEKGLPGAVVVEKAEVPSLSVGSVIRIFA
ncbi:MAG: PTS glucitol/sorbitol transporter subunit IIA [Eubacteriales bacterium]|nr:PTS glucitol/sorbitol transporter subunit IIA [Eubacteriales bacterium]